MLSVMYYCRLPGESEWDKEVVGAQKNRLPWQFTIESVGGALMAIGLYVGRIFSSYFNEFTQRIFQ